MPHLSRHVPQRLDADTPAPVVRGDTARVLRNVRLSPEGALVVNGTVPVTAPPDLLDTVVVGDATDPATGLVYVFRFSPLGDHTLTAYNAATDTEAVVLTWEGLNFTATSQVTTWVNAGALNWLDGVNPARALPLDRVAAYQAALAADPAVDFFTVNRLPPLLPLEPSGYASGSGTSRLLDASLQFSYRYEYVDGQQSVLAPWSRLFEMRQRVVSSATYYDTVLLQVPDGPGRPNALVTAVHFYVRKGNDGAAFRFRSETNPAQFAVSLWVVSTRYDVLNEALTATDATRAFDALPTGPPKAGAGIKNRNHYANFSDGYDAPTGLSLAANLVSAVVGEGKRVWRGGETIRLGLVAYDAFGRNTGVLPETVRTVTIPAFDHSAVTPTCVTQLDCTITATDPLPAWVARVDVVRTDKADATFFVQGAGRLVFYYKQLPPELNDGGTGPKDVYLDSPILLETGTLAWPFDPTTGYAYRIFEPDGIFLDVGNLPLRLRGYTYSPGDRADITYLNPRTTGGATVTRQGIGIAGQVGDLLRLDTTLAAVLDYVVLPTAESSVAATLAAGYVVRYGGAYFGNINNAYFRAILEHSPLSSGVVFLVYTPGVAGGQYVEVGASVAVVAGALESNAVSLPGNVWLRAGELTPLRYDRAGFIDGNVDSWWVIIGNNNGHPGDGVNANDHLKPNRWKWLFNTSPSDLHPAWETDRGRPQAELPVHLRGVRVLETGETYSNKILPETRINGLNVFEATSLSILPVEYGPVTALVPASDAQERGSVLLALHTHETASLQIEEAVLRSTDGSVVSTATSDQVIASNSLLAGGYGCTDAGSITQRGGRVYFWCREKGEWVRYAQNGLTPLGITYKMRSVLRVWQQAAARGQVQGRLVGGYDGFAGEALLHLPRVRGVGGERKLVLAESLTLAFSERQQGFTSYYDYQPEAFIGLPDGLATASQGQLHRHHKGAPATFYATAYPAVAHVTAPAQQPATPVLWQQIVVESNAPWLPTLLANERGQVSKMMRQWLKADRDMWKCALRGWADSLPLLTNARLIHGPRLRSRTLDVTLTLAPEDMPTDTPIRLDAVSVRGVFDTSPLQQ